MALDALAARLMIQVAGIDPYDAQEDADQVDVIQWIASGEPLYRVERTPPTPAKHLAVYIVVLDDKLEKMLLIHHRRAQLWVPAGGHVEPEEAPLNAVLREGREELNLKPGFWMSTELGNRDPFFLTVVDVSTDDGHPHTDVTLWYVMKTDDAVIPSLTKAHREEYDDIVWFSLKGVTWLADMVPDECAPGMARFMNKVNKTLGRAT